MLDLRRTRDESGFTLVELMIALAVAGILIVIAVPVFLGFRDRGNVAVAEASLRNALPAVEAYYADHGTYDDRTMTTAALRSYDSALPTGFRVVSGADAGYCVEARHGGAVASKAGPAAPVVTAPCS